MPPPSGKQAIAMRRVAGYSGMGRKWHVLDETTYIRADIREKD